MMNNRISKLFRVPPFFMNLHRWFEDIGSNFQNHRHHGGNGRASIGMSVYCRPAKDYRICNTETGPA